MLHVVTSGLLAITLLAVTAPAVAAQDTRAAKPAAASVGEPVNVNTATVAQLEALPGVGQRVAERIVDYRTKNGPFKKVEDLMLVPGIGEKTFQLIKPYASISGDTTLKEKVKSSKSSGSKKESR
jgi:competence protein ComEA